jgi:hypothetical protein
VALAWERSPDSSVIGYRIYYGAVSGNYTNSIEVGNVTTGSVPDLADGVTYFFAITAFNTSGFESAFSNELSFGPGLPTVQIRVTAAGLAVLTVNGLMGQTYDLEAAQIFPAWIVIGTVTLGASGSVEFTDTDAANFPQRFYRTKQKP